MFNAKFISFLCMIFLLVPSLHANFLEKAKSKNRLKKKVKATLGMVNKKIKSYGCETSSPKDKEKCADLLAKRKVLDGCSKKPDTKTCKEAVKGTKVKKFTRKRVNKRDKSNKAKKTFKKRKNKSKKRNKKLSGKGRKPYSGKTHGKRKVK